ncbi:hypothetical protein LguiA_019198 [Lonicera macranthoides]
MQKQQIVQGEMFNRKKPRVSRERPNLLVALPEDIVIFILIKLCSSANCPSDFINIVLTCKRLVCLGLHPLVLSNAGPKTLAVRAKNWSDSAHRFLKRCVTSGSIEAAYTLGMIRFYCLQNRESGLSLIASAAKRSHAPALYSLALIHFRGGNCRAGLALCTRASSLGHIDALREIGLCVKHGYGVRRNIAEGCRLLVQANARELEYVLRSYRPTPSSSTMLMWQSIDNPTNMIQLDLDPDSDSDTSVYSGLYSEYGCNLPAIEVHPVNRFLKEWFRLEGMGLGNGLRMCSHVNCGRPEIQLKEFRCCTGCRKVCYCSRACQAHDWKTRHKADCAPEDQWINQNPPDSNDPMD